MKVFLFWYDEEMINKEVFSNVNDVAEKAAEDAIHTLSESINRYGKATWVLAGGSSPMTAYQIIANKYSHSLDWSKVTVLIGDERCVPLDHTDSNWGAIVKVLFSGTNISKALQLVPKAYIGAEDGAQDYSEQIRIICGDTPNFDLLWLGVGEDGHTLSLFPNHPGLNDATDIVIPIYDSPKPPLERITLSIASATAAKKLVIFATGAAKRDALRQLNKAPASLPIGQIAQSTEENGGEVLWLYDSEAKS